MFYLFHLRSEKLIPSLSWKKRHLNARCKVDFRFGHSPPHPNKPIQCERPDVHLLQIQAYSEKPRLAHDRTHSLLLLDSHNVSKCNRAVRYYCRGVFDDGLLDCAFAARDKDQRYFLCFLRFINCSKSLQS